MFPIVNRFGFRFLVLHAFSCRAEKIADLLQIALDGHERDRRGDLLLNLLGEGIVRLVCVMVVVGVVILLMMRNVILAVIVHHLQGFHGVVVRGRQGSFVAEGLEAFFEKFELLELVAIAGGFDRWNQPVHGMLLVVVRVRHHAEESSEPFEEDLRAQVSSLAIRKRQTYFA